jgi:hypothetical protein
MSNTLRYLVANLVLAYKALLGPKAFVVLTKYHKSLEFGGRKVVSGANVSSFYDESKRRELWLLFVVLCHPQASDGEVFPVLVLQGVSRGFQGP